MNFQDASNLRIPEGYVRTIHDKDSRLLWGSVGYDVSFDGNATQTAYSGKNKVDGANPTSVNYATVSLSNDIVTVSSTSTVTIPFAIWVIDGLSQNDVIRYSAVIQDNNGQITLQFDNNGKWTTINGSVRQYSDGTTAATYSWTNAVNTTKVRLLLYANKSKPTSSSSSRYKNVILTVNNSDLSFEPFVGGTPAPNPQFPMPISTVTGEQTVRVTGKNLLSDNFSDYTVGRAYTYLNDILRNGVEARFTFFDKDTSVDISGINIGFCNHYEGSGALSLYRWAISDGVIQPNTTNIPVGYSQPLLNSIVIFPKTKATFDALFARYYIMVELGSTATAYEPYQGQSQTINLGELGLAKIGDYQDYIYKSGDDWYVHKAINKVIFNGSEAWNMFPGRNGTFYITKRDIMLASSTTATPNVISNYYEPKPFDSLYKMTVDYGIANHNAQYWIAIRNKDYSDVSSFKTWLASNNTTVYYVLATPTDTQIADATLIAQLEAVYDWVRRHGYNAQVSGVLPIIINRTALPTV